VRWPARSVVPHPAPRAADSRGPPRSRALAVHQGDQRTPMCATIRSLGHS